MTTPAPASPTGSLPAVTGSWKIFVLWAGLPLCLFGMTWHGLWQEWEAGRFGELILLSLLVWGLSWPLRRFALWPLASTLALFWSLALVLFAGALPVAATLLLAVSALAVGSLVAERQPFALQIACGLVVMGALLAWLLLLPLHTRWTYLALCLIPIVLRYRYLAVAFQQTRSHWQKAIAADPRAAAHAFRAEMQRLWGGGEAVTPSYAGGKATATSAAEQAADQPAAGDAGASAGPARTRPRR